MKTKITAPRLVALALTMSAILASPAVFAGSGSGTTIWRTQNNSSAPTAATPAFRPCTDARVLPVVTAQWNRGHGRAVISNETTPKLVCTSCVTSTPPAKASDRNAHSPKPAVATRATHDCSQSGCGGALALAR